MVAYFAIHHTSDERGYITYDTDTKAYEVVFDFPELKERVVAYLTHEQAVENATGLDTYETVHVDPLSSLANLKLALTRMWERNGIIVDWGVPVEIDGVFHFSDDVQ